MNCFPLTIQSTNKKIAKYFNRWKGCSADVAEDKTKYKCKNS